MMRDEIGVGVRVGRSDLGEIALYEVIRHLPVPLPVTRDNLVLKCFKLKYLSSLGGVDLDWNATQ